MTERHPDILAEIEDLKGATMCTETATIAAAKLRSASSAPDYIALAKRAEEAPGSDRELDWAIWRMQPGYESVRSRASGLFPKGDAKAELQWAMRAAPHYTGSLDTSFGLIPKRRYWLAAWRELRDESRHGGDHLSLGLYVAMLMPVSGDGAIQTEARTPALALTAACLRAQAELVAKSA